MPKVYSRKQARFFGAMIGDKIPNPPGAKMSDSALRKSLRGKKVKSLPARSRKSR
jgi:hypothetical protein